MKKYILLLVCLFLASLVSATTCYQETANQSTLGDGNCSLNYNGSYRVVYGNGGGIYINYTKPYSSFGALWVIKFSNKSIQNITIPRSCLNANPQNLSLMMQGYVGPSVNPHSNFYCINETNGFELLAFDSGTYTDTNCTVDNNYYAWIDGDWSSYSAYKWASGYANCTGPNDYKAYIYEEAIIWDAGIIINDNNYTKEVFATSVQEYKLNLSYDSSTYIYSNISLVYNGTSYLVTSSDTGNNKLFTKELTAPSVNSRTNISFYWEINLIDANGTILTGNTSITNQTINPLNIYSCESGENLALNFTVYDLADSSRLNSSFEANFNYFLGNGVYSNNYSYSNTNNNQSNFLFCFNSSTNATLNAFISYYAPNYARREYIISNGIIGNFTQNIPLYLINSSLTTPITLSVTDQNYNPLSGALVNIQQWNIGTNTYSSVGMITTGSDGKGTIDLELYNVWYRAVVTYNGNIVKTTNVTKLSSTTWPIIANLNVNNPYELFGTISHGLTFNNLTNVTTFTWVDTSGYTQIGCLIVQNLTSLGPQTLYNSCLSTTSGTISYLLSGNGEYQVYGIIYLNSAYNVSQITDHLNIRLGTPTLTKTVSPYGKVISFIIIGTCGAIGVAAGSIILGCILIILAALTTMYLGWLNITWGIIWGIIIIIILILARLSRRNA